MLCAGWLQPLRDALGRVIVTSGKRSPELNEVVGGTANSHHLYRGDQGAVDFYVEGRNISDAATWLRNNAPTFRRMILYADRGFIHLESPNSDGLYKIFNLI